MIRDTPAYAQALADVLALRPVDSPHGPGAPRTPGECCTGDRDGWLWHWRHDTTPCASAVRANAAWAHETRHRRPGTR